MEYIVAEIVKNLEEVTFKKSATLSKEMVEKVESLIPDFYQGFDMRGTMLNEEKMFIVGKNNDKLMLAVFNEAANFGSFIFLTRSHEVKNWDMLIGSLLDFKVDIDKVSTIVHRGKTKFENILKCLEKLRGVIYAEQHEEAVLHGEGENIVSGDDELPVQEPEVLSDPVNDPSEIDSGVHNPSDDGIQLVDREDQKQPEDFGILDRFQFMKYMKLSALIKEYGFEKNSESQSIKVDIDKMNIGKGKPVFMRVTLKKQGRFSSLEISRSAEPESVFVFKRADKKIRVTKKEDKFILSIKKTKDDVTDKVIAAIEDFFKGGEPDEIVL